MTNVDKARQNKTAKRLFGSIAVDLKLVDNEQIIKAREIQDRTQNKKQKLIGEILVELGYIKHSHIEDICDIQKLESEYKKIKGYKLLELVGRGGMGVVYKATQLSMDRAIALKILNPNLVSNTEYINRFLREARASAKLNHINIIKGYDFGESNSLYFFAMEFVDGQTISKIIKRGGALDEIRALNLTLQIAKALKHAHQHDIIHRDIKPDNIMLNSDNIPKLCDLGLAKVSATIAKNEIGKTLGTPHYISPEQAKGEAKIDGRSDIYSLGATLFHMITGKTPYEGNAAVVMSKQVNDPVPDPKLLVPDISSITRTIVMKMMAKKRDGRYQSAKSLIREIERTISYLENEKNVDQKTIISKQHKSKHKHSKFKVGIVRKFQGSKLSSGKAMKAPKPVVKKEIDPESETVTFLPAIDADETKAESQASPKSRSSRSHKRSAIRKLIRRRRR